jgi:sucrose synthase
VIAGLRHAASRHRDGVYLLLHHYLSQGKPFLLSSDLEEGFRAVVGHEVGAPLIETALREVVAQGQEAALSPPWLLLALRPRPGSWQFVRVHAETLDFEEIGVSDYLDFKERIVDGRPQELAWPLEIDLRPFQRHLPRLRELHSVGRGGEFLNRRLAGELFADSERGLRHLFRFLSLHTCRGQQLMINPSIADVEGLRTAVRSALSLLSGSPDEAVWHDLEDRLRGLGFEPGWGRTAARMRDSLQLLQDILEAPDPTTFEALLARIPMVFRVAILSPHGYFGQANVMGLPDTGGQVVYILDQVRAVEREMRRRLVDQGVDFEPEIAVVTRLIPDHRGTTSDQRLEAIAGTHSARILRVPFRTPQGEIVDRWISRFSVWPYLERFALEAERELLAELGGRPDLIIGNYSDGNLVATLMAQRLGVTQCAIAHALEKSKYLFSDLYWRHNEDQYHFSCQFVADLVAMNAADFIITSTFQEIAGDSTGVGQYESYSAFTMPGMLRVVHGVDIFDPRFNIISPGVDPDTYFPFGDEDRRLRGLAGELDELLRGPGPDDTLGELLDPDRPIVLSMARMDRIKNLTGLVRLFGASDRLREVANLVVVGGKVDVEASSDPEERSEIESMHRLLDELELEGRFRWIGRLLDKPLAGELYRVIADRGGVFVQPALFEAFGLTVIEAMTSGLPTFATRYGGPAEIIQHGVSGFHIDPNQDRETADLIADFLERAAVDRGVWLAVSRAGVERVEARYTWKQYADRLMTLSRVYGFWRYTTSQERSGVNAYLQTLYDLKLRPRAEELEG